MKTKKASIGTALTWIVAEFIIIIILVLYFVFLGISYEAKSVEVQDITISYSDFELSAVDSFIDFLKSDIGNGESVYDLLKKAGNNDEKESEREKIFEERAFEFLKKNYPLDSSIIRVSKILLDDEEIIYSAYYDAMPPIGEVPETFRDYLDISIFISSDKKVNLMGSVR